jgi:hypothetical protein
MQCQPFTPPPPPLLIKFSKNRKVNEIMHLDYTVTSSLINFIETTYKQKWALEMCLRDYVGI